MGRLAAEWKPTGENLQKFSGIAILRGGPDPGYLPEHAHPEIEVSVHFRPGLPGGLIPEHAHLYASQQPHRGGWKKQRQVLVFKLSPNIIERAADDWSCRRNPVVQPFHHLRDPLFEGIAAGVLRQHRIPGGVTSLYAESVANLLAAHILREYSEAQPRLMAVSALTESELSRAVRFIEESMEKGFTVADLAGAMGLRAQEFSRKLRFATGLSPWKFVERHKLSLARRHLANRGLAISEIALRLGFTDQSHFTHAFRKAVGLTPSAYRRSH